MPSPLWAHVQETPPWPQWAVAEILAHQLLEQEVANLRGYCRSRCQQLKETRVWLDGECVQNPLVERPFVCVCVCNPQSAREEECQWDPGLLRFAQVSPVLRRVLEKPSVLLLALQLAGCPASPPAGLTLEFTEPRLPHPREGGIPSCLKAPPAPATPNNLIFTVIMTGHSWWRAQQFWLTQFASQKDSRSSLYLCTVNLFLWGKFFFFK